MKTHAGYTQDLRHVTKDGSRLFIVVHDAKQKRHECDIKPEEVVHAPSMRWDEKLRRYVE